MSDLIPKGIYKGRAIRGVWRASNNKSTPFADITCEITSEGPFKGHRLPCSLYLTDNTEERTYDSLVACGVDVNNNDDIKSLKGIDRNEVEFQVGHSEATAIPDKPGEFYPVRARVDWINNPNFSAVGREQTPQELMASVGRLAGIRARRAAGGPAGGPPPPPPPPGAAPTGPGGGGAGAGFNRF